VVATDSAFLSVGFSVRPDPRSIKPRLTVATPLVPGLRTSENRAPLLAGRYRAGGFTCSLMLLVYGHK